MYIGFTKMHGLGNDFVVIDNFNGKINLSKEQIQFLCDRHKGIGADGVILVETKDGADCFMNYLNSDGSEAQMCGNGVRCVAKFLKDDYLKDKNSFRIFTRAGEKEVVAEEENIFSVNMGKPEFSSPDFPEKSLEIKGYSFDFVSMGNPHAVAFAEDVEGVDLDVIGPQVENDKNFPNKINVELVEEKSFRKYKMRVWERGCGETLACGTGACAVYAICRKNKNAAEQITIHLPGGDLELSENQAGEIIMQGPAETVYSSVIEL